ncbi:MAG TPA: glycosyltransferase family protein [Chitinophagales bacterium]|nr:glycosyltransferase family protein [Chitinophagales bacterium]
MKILFGIQATGNGHISRSTEIYKLLKQHPDVTQLDVLISGGKAKMSLPFEVNYEYKGLSFYYGKKGKISVLKSIGKAGFLSIAVALWKVPFREYDLVISDFEPITLWGAKIAGVKRVGIGNMYSMSSKKFPKTKGRRITNLIARMMCPTKNKIAMHFQKFDDFVYYPIIRSEIRDVIPADRNFTLVYLNSFSDAELMNCFAHDSFAKQKFVIYSKEASHAFVYQNCEVKPLSNDTFIQDIANCSGVITAGGFQTISEALYLGKKLFVIPIKKQSEQISNARILSSMGVKTSMDLNKAEIADWLENPNTVQVKFEDDLQNIVDAILCAPHTPRRQRKAA